MGQLDVAHPLQMSPVPHISQNSPLHAWAQNPVPKMHTPPGQSLPPHTHGDSDVTLFAIEGSAVIETESGPRRFPAGSLAILGVGEELQVSNPDAAGFTMLAVFAPAFPAAR